MVLFLVAHSLSELTSGCNRTARFLEILFGDVRTLSAMKTRRITKQKIAFAVQAVDAILVNDHARILFKSHLERNASGEAAAQGRRHNHFIWPLRSKDKMNPAVLPNTSMLASSGSALSPWLTINPAYSSATTTIRGTGTPFRIACVRSSSSSRTASSTDRSTCESVITSSFNALLRFSSSPFFMYTLSHNHEANSHLTD